MAKKKAVKKTEKAQLVKVPEVEPAPAPPALCWVANCTSAPPCTKHGPKPEEVDNG